MIFFHKYRRGDFIKTKDNVYEISGVGALLFSNFYKSIYLIKGLGYVTEDYISQGDFTNNITAYNYNFLRMRSAKFNDLEFSAETPIQIAIGANNELHYFVIHESGLAVSYDSLTFL